ncbi:MAG: NUDIX hydrolase [Ignavibacteria bacterium]|nr:NUDIX hydrolase [Ignavibacteria bacterium]
MLQITDISDPRLPLFRSLLRYRAAYPDETVTVGQMLGFLSRNTGCFERSTEEGHFTGSAWLVHPDNSTFLLTHHRKLGKWLQLGGHADGNHDVLDVAIKEAVEESGIKDIEVLQTEIFDVDIHRIPARTGEPEHLHYDVRYLLRSRSASYCVSNESHDLAWINADELHHFTQEHSMLRMTSKWNAIKSQFSSTLP